MKKTSSSPAVSASLSFWRTVAILAVCVVAGLVFGILKELRAPGKIPEPVAAAEAAPTPAQPELKGPYAALGSHVAQKNRIAELGWSAQQFQEFLDGVRAAYEGRGLPLDEEAKKLRDEIDQRAPSPASDQPDAVEDYFRSLRENEGVSRTESGLHYRVMEENAGPQPKSDDVVVISFSVQQPDGEERSELNRSHLRIRASELPPALAEGVQLLSVGGKALLYVPAEHSLDPTEGSPASPTTMPLAFSLELHEIAEPASR